MRLLPGRVTITRLPAGSSPVTVAGIRQLPRPLTPLQVSDFNGEPIWRSPRSLSTAVDQEIKMLSDLLCVLLRISWRKWATGRVLPPLLFSSILFVIAWFSWHPQGHPNGRREVAPCFEKPRDTQANKQGHTCPNGPCHVLSHPPKFRRRGGQSQVCWEAGVLGGRTERMRGAGRHEGCPGGGRPAPGPGLSSTQAEA